MASTSTMPTNAVATRAVEEESSFRSLGGIPQATHYRDHAVATLLRVSILQTILPLSLLTWWMTKSWIMVVFSIVFMPVLVTMQGCVSMITFRIIYGNPPSPVTPRHGVVVVHPHDKKKATTTTNTLSESTTRATTTTTDQEGLEPVKAPLKKTSLSSTTNKAMTIEEEEADYYDVPYETNSFNPERADFLRDHTLKQRPLRLLFVGDSMAVGVGQCLWPTPVMPETLARTLSKRMGGRAIYWTCHGATGASIGWVIRELERGPDCLDDNNNIINTMHGEIPAQCFSDGTRTTTDETLSSSSDTHNKNNGHGVGDGGATTVNGFVVEGEVSNIDAWRQSLDQHRERFELDLRGFYDIVVFVAGPNDAKSAVMPFLLTGEDSELRRQAQARGSCLYHDLHLFLQTLTRNVKGRVQQLKQSVQETAESVLDTVSDTLHIRTHSSSSSPFNTNAYSHSKRMVPQEPAATNKDDHHQHHADGQHPHHHHHHDHHTHDRHPLVVFPGMPYHSSPAFQNFPVIWYGGPPIGFYAPALLEIVDGHKRDLAAAYPNDIMYIPPPSEEIASEYAMGTSSESMSKGTEDVILSLRDITEQESREQQARLRMHYQNRFKSVLVGSPFRNVREMLGLNLPVTYKGYAADGLHLNEVGYDMWGRYLGEAIYQAWEEKREDSSLQ